MPHRSSPPLAVALLGYAGLLPFLGAAVGAWLPVTWAPAAAFFFMGYSAAILAFLGGLQWGIALQPDIDRPVERFAVGVLPALAAAVALPIGVRWGGVLLLVGFLALLIWDLQRNRAVMPDWYPRLRIHLTTGVALCHLGFMARFLLP